MGIKKMVDRDKLYDFHEQLQFTLNKVKDYTSTNLIMALIDTYEREILEKTNENINEVKRIIYYKMKNAATKEENKQYYEIYCRLKEASSIDKGE